MGLGGVHSKSASLQPCFDVDETRRKTSNGSLSIISGCADGDLRVIGILVQTESITINDEGQLSCIQNVQERAQYGSLQIPKQYRLDRKQVTTVGNLLHSINQK